MDNQKKGINLKKIKQKYIYEKIIPLLVFVWDFIV